MARKRKAKGPFPSMGMEHASVAVALSLDDMEDGMFKGMASVFDVMIDSFVPTIIHQGAFKKTLAHPQRHVSILWQHDVDTPIGVPVEMNETDEGLEVIGRISDTSAGRDALTLMRDGVVTGLSIGFNATAFHFEEKQKELIRHVEEVDLFEFSPVTFPANKEALISEVQSELLIVVETELSGTSTSKPVALPPIIAFDWKQGTDEAPEVMADKLAELLTLIRDTDQPISDECLDKLSSATEALHAIVEQERRESPSAIAAQALSEVADAELHYHKVRSAT